MKSPTILAATVFAGVLAGAAFAQAASAASVADFYKHRDISLYIGYTPGGGYDTYARTLARHIGRHIPGHPHVVPKNMPGASSLRLTNAIYNTLPQDGTAIAAIGRAMPMEVLFGNKQARFDPTRLNWIGSANNAVSLCVTWHTAHIDTLHKFLTKKLILGATSPGSDAETFPKVLNNVIGTHFDLAMGYPGGSQVNLAMEKGEVQGRCGWSWGSLRATHASWIKNHKIDINVQMSTVPNAELTKMGVPFMMDLAKTKRAHRILTLILARQAMGRPYAMGPGVPTDRVKAMRDAFMATVKDNGYLADAKKVKLDIDPLGGRAVQNLVTEIMSTPPDVVQAAKVAAAQTGNMYIKKVKVRLIKDEGPIAKIKKGGRRIYIKKHGKLLKAKISGSRTEITVNGKKTKRKALKIGMTCVLTYPGPGTEAKKVDCRK